MEISFHFAWHWFRGGLVTQFWSMITKEKFTRVSNKDFSLSKRKTVKIESKNTVLSIFIFLVLPL